MLPGPTNVPNRVMNAMLAPIINHRSDDFRTLYKSIIEKTQKLFQTESDVVLLSCSGTGAVESSVVNLIKKGDKVVIPVKVSLCTAGQFNDSWGGQSLRIESQFGENPPYEKFEQAFDEHKDIKALYAVYNETSTGTTIRYMDKLGDLCAKQGCFFIADSVSILGGDDLPTDKWNIDVCITASQAIAAPPGVSPISISPKAKNIFKITLPLYCILI